VNDRVISSAVSAGRIADDLAAPVGVAVFKDVKVLFLASVESGNVARTVETLEILVGARLDLDARRGVGVSHP
jgi:hypothetical protein